MDTNFFPSLFQLLECPSIYELMACLDYKWEHVPLLEIWKKRCDSDGNSTTVLETYPPVEAIPIFMEALSTNQVSHKFDADVVVYDASIFFIQRFVFLFDFCKHQMILI